jgi:CTP synthase
VRRVVEPRAAARVAVVGKYTDYIDSYKSVQESLVHGGIAHDVGVDVDWVSSDLFTSAERAREILAGYDGLLVPGGFGVRGVEGMVEAIRAARETGCRSSASASACRRPSSSSRGTCAASKTRTRASSPPSAGTR